MTARDKLLGAASELFYADGIAATGVDDVVRAAGVSKPTLYAHFGSKAELVAAVLERCHAARAAGGPARAPAGGERAGPRAAPPRRARAEGLDDPDGLASRLCLLIDGVAARVVVDGHEAAAGAVAEATSAARTLC